MMHLLFIYGTLRDSSIRYKITGRVIMPLKNGFLSGYKLTSILLGGTEYPIILEDPKANTAIEGDVIEITQKELSLLDEYEGSEYRRVKVLLQDGTSIWAYTG